MDKNLVSFESGRTILNVNAITMIFPDDNEKDMTCVNVIGGNRTFYINESYESVKEKLDGWLMKEPSNPKVRDKCKAWKFNDEYCRCCSQSGDNPCFEKEENDAVSNN
jgi:hypothetical protein